MLFSRKNKFREDEKYILLILFLLIYSIIWLYSFIQESTWIIDNSIAIISVVFMFYMIDKIKLKKIGFILFNVALLSHNIGSFGLYNYNYGMFGYDNIVHLLSSIVAAYIIFNLVIEKFHSLGEKSFRKNKSLFIFFVISATVTLGVMIEIAEYSGDNAFGEGEGILLRGAGDSDPSNEGITSQYNDTMQDIIVNIIGSIIGALGYYHFRIKYSRRNLT